MTSDWPSGAAGRGAVVAVALATVAAIGWIDHATGPEVGLSLFYLVPVAVSAWTAGRAGGGVTAVTAAGSWLAADLLTRTGSETGPILWNGFSRLVIFGGAAMLLAQLRSDQEALRRLNAELRRRAEAEGRLARTDPLTGLRNRRAFLEDLRAEIARCARTGEPVCLAYLDVDGFKRLNDARGHEAGDDLLRSLSQSLQASAREADISARLGGDEFAVLLRSVGLEAARGLSSRLLASLLETCRARAGGDLAVSMGVAHFASPPASPEDALDRADAAMYRAKRGGAGRLVVWSDAEGSVEDE